jgi:hypothetical protein
MVMNSKSSDDCPHKAEHTLNSRQTALLSVLDIAYPLTANKI